MPGPTLLKRDWQKDHVYLVQFPRAGCIPSPSPFALKLETWIRIAGLDYTNISNEFKHNSTKGQIPFIELNGRQVPDSAYSIKHLEHEFHKEELEGVKAPQDKATLIAYTTLIESVLFGLLIYHRGKDNKWFATEEGLIGNLSGVKRTLFKAVLNDVFRKKIWNTAWTVGWGRHSVDEMDGKANDALDALSVLLADKPYFFGDKPSTLDAVAFGFLAQIIYTPLTTNTVKEHIDQKTSNLKSLIERIKTTYWPDWDEATGKSLNLNAHKKKDEQPPAAAAN